MSAATETPRLRVDVWSDVACPWCYMGLTYLDKALADFDHGDQIDVVLHSFELDPGAPVRDEVPLVTRLARKYGTTEEQIEASQTRISQLGKAVDIEFNFEVTARGSTFDAHRLLHLAADHGSQVALKRRLFVDYFTDGKVVGDADTLRQAADAVGLPSDEVEAVLSSDRYTDAVQADIAQAHELGVTGVPFFLFDGDLGLAGAQPPERMLQVLDRVWAERRPEPAGLLDDLAADGEVCGPSGCA